MESSAVPKRLTSTAWLASHSTMAATSRAMASPHSDQATRAAVRAVTGPLGGRGQRTDTPGSLVAQARSIDGAFTYSADVVRLGLVERHPPRGPSRDRYGLRHQHMSWPGLGPSLASVKSAQRRTTRAS